MYRLMMYLMRYVHDNEASHRPKEFSLVRPDLLIIRIGGDFGINSVRRLQSAASGLLSAS